MNYVMGKTTKKAKLPMIILKKLVSNKAC